MLAPEQNPPGPPPPYVPSQVPSLLSQQQLSGVPSQHQPVEALPLRYAPQRQLLQFRICCCVSKASAVTLRRIIFGYASFFAVYGVMSLIVGLATAIAGRSTTLHYYVPYLNPVAFIYEPIREPRDKADLAPAYILILEPLIFDLAPAVLIALPLFKPVFHNLGLLSLGTGIAVDIMGVLFYFRPLPFSCGSDCGTDGRIVALGSLLRILMLTFRSIVSSMFEALMRYTKMVIAMRAGAIVRSQQSMMQQQLNSGVNGSSPSIDDATAEESHETA